MQQVQKTFTQTPLPQLAGQHGGDHALTRRQRRRLMHQADPRAQTLTLAGRQVPGAFAEHFNLAAAGPQGGGQQVEQTRLTGPGRANDGDLFTNANLQVDTAQGVDSIGVAQAALFEA
ncbi:hypothetical protein D3C78_1627110 [compost metagenome]